MFLYRTDEMSKTDNNKKENGEEKVKRTDDWRHSLGNHVTMPIASFLAKLHLTPDALTWMGLLFSFGALALLFTDHLIWCGVVTLAGALFDSLDGALARYTNKITIFGGILDSTLDRLSEGLMFGGISVWFAMQGNWIACAVTVAAVVMSYMVSYIRARAEAASIECSCGIFTRAERIAVMVLGLLTGFVFYAMIIIAFLSMVTAGQRLARVYRNTKK